MDTLTKFRSIIDEIYFYSGKAQGIALMDLMDWLSLGTHIDTLLDAFPPSVPKIKIKPKEEILVAAGPRKILEEFEKSLKSFEHALSYAPGMDVIDLYEWDELNKKNNRLLKVVSLIKDRYPHGSVEQLRKNKAIEVIKKLSK